jgi:luciferase family oxidoreductase group 1
LTSDPDDFPRDVQELAEYFSDTPRQAVRAVPGTGLHVPLWILGSSLFGAQVAAAFGLPYAFASHFAPAHMMAAIELYRSEFRASRNLAKPYVMLGFNVFGADSLTEATFQASSMQQAFVNLRSGRPSQLPPPVEGYTERLGSQERALLGEVLSCTSIGTPYRIRADLCNFVEQTGADELLITSQVFDHTARPPALL